MCCIRDYRPGDEEAVFEIVEQVLAEYGLTTNPAETDADLDDIHDSYIAGGGTFKILEEDGRIIGSYGLYPTTPRSCELRKMYLLPEFRGQGLGRRMLEDALGRARRLGFEEMTLETNSRLREAISLYRCYGFAKYTPEHMSDRCVVVKSSSHRRRARAGNLWFTGYSPLSAQRLSTIPSAG
jgi:putative acetyltransferase